MDVAQSWKSSGESQPWIFLLPALYETLTEPDQGRLWDRHFFAASRCGSASKQLSCTALPDIGDIFSAISNITAQQIIKYVLQCTTIIHQTVNCRVCRLGRSYLFIAGLSFDQPDWSLISGLMANFFIFY